MKKQIILVLLSFVSIFMLNLPASAATSNSRPPGSSGLSISPLRSELTLKPGQANKIDITLKNITGGDIVAKVTVREFVSDNVSGNPKVITDPNFKSPNSIKPFLIGLGDVPLSVGEQKSFSVPVQAPSNATPGAYFGLVEYQAVPKSLANSSGNNVVALSAGVSQLVFITVPGQITQKVAITAIHIYRDKDGNSEGLFFTHPPQSAGIEVKNLGNGFAKPFGHISVQNTTGHEVYHYELNGTITRAIVLPNSSRIFKDAIKNVSKPGRYSIVANVSYGDGSAILTAKKTFWYIPAMAIWIIIAVLVVLVIAAVLAYRRYKRGNQRSYKRQ